MHWHIHQTLLALHGRHGHGCQRTDADLEWRKLAHITHAAIHHHAGPAILLDQLADIAADKPIYYYDLGGWAKLILGVTMVIGRLETLAVLALLVPSGWRRLSSGW